MSIDLEHLQDHVTLLRAALEADARPAGREVAN